MKYTQGVDARRFEDDEILQDAVIRQVQIIGEAARALSPETKSENPHIPWQGMIGLRNRLVHHYFGIDVPLVWEVVERDIPNLITLIEPIVPMDTDS